MKKIFRDMQLEKYIVEKADFKPFGGKSTFPDVASCLGTEIIRQAEEYLNKEIPVLPASLYMRFAKDGNRVAFEDVYFDRHWAILTLMTAECIEKKGRFLTRLMDYMWSVAEESTWILPAHYHHTLNILPEDRPNLPNRFDGKEIYIDLFSAETASHLALVYYFLGDEIKRCGGKIVIDRVLYEIDKRIIQPYLTYEHMPWMGLMDNRVNNWSTWITSNLLLTAGITIADLETRQKIVAKAERTLDNFIFWYGDDGGCDEGPAYWDGAGGALFDCLEILRDLTGGRKEMFSASLKPIMEYACKVNINDSYYIPCGDSHSRILHSGERIYRMGQAFNSPELKTFGKKHIRPEWMLGHMPYKKIYSLFTEPDNEEIDISFDFMYLPDLQLCAMRETKASDKGFYAWLKGGHNGENHNHNDVGNVGVYLDGKPLFIDIGSKTYTAAYFDRSTRYTLFPVRSFDHNLPLIDGKGQLAGRDYSTDYFEADEATKTARVGIKNAYENKNDICELSRQLSLCDGRVKICEKAALNTEFDVEYRFYTTEKPVLNEKGEILLGRRAIMNYDKELCCEINRIDFDDQLLIKSWGQNCIYLLKFSVSKTKDISTEFCIEKL